MTIARLVHLLVQRRPLRFRTILTCLLVGMVFCFASAETAPPFSTLKLLTCFRDREPRCLPPNASCEVREAWIQKYAARYVTVGP
jgi:hypothetical protein